MSEIPLYNQTVLTNRDQCIPTIHTHSGKHPFMRASQSCPALSQMPFGIEASDNASCMIIRWYIGLATFNRVSEGVRACVRE